MKSFIAFVALIAVVSANNVGRAGWGSGNKPSIDLEVVAAAAAAAAGQAAAGQTLLESAAGNNANPALISSFNGVDAAVLQGEDIEQVNVANKPSGATSTVNVVDVYNQAVAEDVLEGIIEGGLGASVQNNAASNASGEGSVAAQDSSLNNVSNNGGWRQ